MSIAALLSRAKKVVAGEILPALETGAHIVANRGIDSMPGRVAFEDDNWVFWCDAQDTVHATPRTFITRAT